MSADSTSVPQTPLQQEVFDILQRLNSKWHSFAKYAEQAEWEPEEKQEAFWLKLHVDVQKAEAIAGFTGEELAHHNHKLETLRRDAIQALKDIGEFSVMLWEQMSEFEEFELDPEDYWTSIITRARKQKAAREAFLASLPKSPGELIALITALPVEEDPTWVRKVGDIFVKALNLRQMLVTSPAARVAVAELVNQAYESLEFAHCSLSLAEDMRYELEAMPRRAGYVP